jgi:Leucine-rich repeat (LRR) protein
MSSTSASGMLTLLSLRKELIEDRLALHRHQGGQMDGNNAAGHNQQSAVLELVLDRMAIKDCGECDGATQSPLVDYLQLRRLTLNFNHLTKLHTSCVVQPLLELRELEIDFNKLTSFGPLRNQRLEQMSLSHNVLTTIAGLALPRLHTLDLSHNLLGREFVAAAMSAKDPSLRLPSLTALDISHNKLTTLDWVGQLTKLSTLRAAHNCIASLQGIQTCLALEEMDVSHNKLRFTATTQTNNPLKAVGRTLQQLDVSHNDISSLAFFPPGAMTKCWSLSIANNMFHGSKKAESTPADGGVLRGARRASSTTSTAASIFASDDIGDATYGDDDGGKAMSGAARPASRGGTPANFSGGRNSVAPSLASTTIRRGPSSDDAVTFLARLAQLFPALEALDLTNNSEEIIADASDLRFLAKCTNLTELSIKGTLSFAPSVSSTSSARAGRIGTAGQAPQLEAIRSFLPQIEVLDGTVLVKREAAAVAVEDLETLGITDSAALFALSKSSNQQRPTSALLRPGTSSQQKSIAIQSSKALDGLADFQQEMEAFMHRAELSRRKVNHIMDHMQRMAAWAYHDDAAPTSTAAAASTTRAHVDEPAPLDLNALEADIERALIAEGAGALQHEGAGSRGNQLSDSDDDVADGVDRLVMPVGDGTPRTVSPATSSTSSSRQQPRPPAKGASAKDFSSPSKKRVVERSSSVQPAPQSRATSSPSAAGGHHAPRSSSSSSTDSRQLSLRSSAATSSLYSESEAMKRIKSLPTSTFALEQSKFKHELQLEAQKRREQLTQLAKEASAKLPVPRAKKGLAGSMLNVGALERPSTGKSEAGTSMVSPAKGSLAHTSSGAGPHSSGHAGRGERVTTSTATSPPKALSGSSQPSAASSGPASTPVANQVVGATQRPSVPKLDFDTARRSPVVVPEDELLEVDSKPPSNVVTDPRNARRRSDAAITPSDDVGVDASGLTPPSAAPQTQHFPLSNSARLGTQAPLSLHNTARPLSASLSMTGGGAAGGSSTSLKRADPNHGVSTVPKVKTTRDNVAFNPLLKEVPTARITSGPSPVAVTTSANEAQAGEDADEELTYFSTKPISTQPVMVKGGGSLNRRGPRK